MIKPYISVIMPVLNAEKYVSEAINSILNQSFRNFEFLIIDDGSDDKSVKIIKSFNDPRIKLYARPRLGISEQLNFGIKNSNAELIARMDADDISDLSRLETQYDYIKAKRDLSLVGTNYCMIDEEGKVIIQKLLPEHPKEIEFMMPIFASVLHATVLIKRKVIVEIGGYNEESIYGEDHELFLKLLLNGYRMYNIQKSLFKYRIYKPRRSNDLITMQNRIVYKNGLKYLQTKYSAIQKISFDYLFRHALLEYYRGRMDIARKFLFKSIKVKPSKFFLVLRYLLVSFLGNRIIEYLRKNNVLIRMNLMLSKYLKKDLHLINTKLIVN